MKTWTDKNIRDLLENEVLVAVANMTAGGAKYSKPAVIEAKLRGNPRSSIHSYAGKSANNFVAGTMRKFLRKNMFSLHDGYNGRYVANANVVKKYSTPIKTILSVDEVAAALGVVRTAEPEKLNINYDIIKVDALQTFPKPVSITIGTIFVNRSIPNSYKQETKLSINSAVDVHTDLVGVINMLTAEANILKAKIIEYTKGFS